MTKMELEEWLSVDSDAPILYSVITNDINNAVTYRRKEAVEQES